MTSSAVVGSSAISTLGLQASAMAIIARWRMPPESWCGYSRARCAGSGIRTKRSISTALSRVADFARSWCSRIASLICSPMVSTGLSEVIGSWKTIESSLPRTLRMAASSSCSRSRPSSVMLPPTIRPGGSGTSCMMESAVMLLPQPDSPTTASVSPRLSEKETPSTALRMPARVKKKVCSPATSSTLPEIWLAAVTCAASGPADRAPHRRADWYRTPPG